MKRFKVLLENWELEFTDHDIEFDSEFVEIDMSISKSLYYKYPTYAHLDPDDCISNDGKMAYATIDFYDGEIDSIRIDWGEDDEMFYASEIVYTDWDASEVSDYYWESEM